MRLLTPAPSLHIIECDTDLSGLVDMALCVGGETEDLYGRCSWNPTHCLLYGSEE